MYAVEKGAPLDERVFSALATSPSCSKRAAQAVFARLRQQRHQDGLSCPSGAYFSAARAGNTAFLASASPLPADRYPEFAEHLLLAAAAGCSFNDANCLKKVNGLLRRHTHTQQLSATLTEASVLRVCVAAAGAGRLPALRYVHEVIRPSPPCVVLSCRVCDVAPLFVAMEQGRSDRMTSSPSFVQAVLNSSVACCGEGSGAGRALLEDRARAALSFFRRFGYLPQAVPFDVRVRAAFRWRRRALQRAVHRIEDAWLAYQFAPRGLRPPNPPRVCHWSPQMFHVA